MMHWGMWGGSGWGMGFGWIFMILFWTLVILGVVYIVQAVVKGGRKSAARCDDPIAILKMRYARGELTREQFEGMRQELRKV